MSWEIRMLNNVCLKVEKMLGEWISGCAMSLYIGKYDKYE